MSVLQDKAQTPPPATNPFRDGLGALLFASRWVQAPLYLGLIVAQLMYVFTPSAREARPFRAGREAHAAHPAATDR